MPSSGSKLQLEMSQMENLLLPFYTVGLRDYIGWCGAILLT